MLELSGLSQPSKLPATDLQEPRTRIFHAVNPSATTWSELHPIVSKYLGPSVKVVSWEEWISALRTSAERGEVELNPGIKLLGFYEAADERWKERSRNPVLGTQETVAGSATLRVLGAVSDEWMGTWMEQWGY